MSNSSGFILAFAIQEGCASPMAKRPRKIASQERSRATVATLLDATARILVNEGFDRASTNRIAEVAGVSIGSLYQYFSCKEALILGVIERHNLDIMRVVGNTLDEIDSLAVEEAIPKLIAVALESHRVDPKLHKVLTEQTPRVGPLEDVETVSRTSYARFKRYLEGRKEELSVANVELAAFVCATTIEALAHNAVLHSGETLTDQSLAGLTDDTTRLVLGYLKTR